MNNIKDTWSDPASNGLVERFNQTFKQALRASIKDGRTLSHRLSDFLLTYRSTPHATTSRTPASLFLNRQLRTRLSFIQPHVSNHVTSKQASQITNHDQHARPRLFKEGQKDMVCDFHSHETKWIPATISMKTGPLTYTVTTSEGIEWRRHADHIRDYYPAKVLKDTITATNNEFVDLLPLPEPEADTVDNTPSEEQRRYPRHERVPPDRYE